MEKPHQQKREDKKRLAENKREAKKQKLKTTIQQKQRTENSKTANIHFEKQMTNKHQEQKQQ